MTCQQLRQSLEERLCAGTGPLGREVERHVAGCAACRQFVNHRRDLATGFTAVRESVGRVPESVDAAVLAGYREHLAEQSSVVRVRKLRPVAVWGWSAAVAAMLLAIAMVLFAVRRPVATVHLPSVGSPAVQPSSVVLPPAAAATITASVRHEKRSLGSKSATANQTRPVHSLSAFPEEFRSLMYCDELSCTGGMDVIRVQLPFAFAARPAAGFVPASGPVNADVLVGSDGIARAIRIAE
jgi:hypothetical protein